MTVSIEIQGIPELKRYMKDKQLMLKTKIPLALRKATLYTHGKVKESISRGTNAPIAVDTGRFLNSVDFQSGEDFSIIFSDLSYAKYIEFGTSKMNARPHFKNTSFKENDKIRQFIDEAVKKAISGEITSLFKGLKAFK